jgi:DNA helicase-2/ATP-dependent DNA helicase PcrA
LLSVLRGECLRRIAPDDVETRDEVIDAIEVLREGSERGVPIRRTISEMPVDTRSTERSLLGLNFLNAHVGKGQQFDWVIVVGMEEGFIPSFQASTAAERAEELRVLHVMCSRARSGLVVTVTGPRLVVQLS